MQTESSTTNSVAVGDKCRVARPADGERQRALVARIVRTVLVMTLVVVANAAVTAAGNRLKF